MILCCVSIIGVNVKVLVLGFQLGLVGLFVITELGFGLMHSDSSCCTRNLFSCARFANHYNFFWNLRVVCCCSLNPFSHQGVEQS